MKEVHEGEVALLQWVVWGSGNETNNYVISNSTILQCMQRLFHIKWT